MLTDVLQTISVGRSNKLCKLGEIYRSLDDETQEALSEALKSEAPTMDICRALKSEGISVGREFLGSKRACFKNADPTCCLSSNQEEVK